MNRADERLQRLLGGEALAALRQRLRRRFERCAPDMRLSAVRLDALTPAEYCALGALLGRPPRAGASMHVDVEAIDAALRRAGLAASLRDALERLDGRIVDRAAERTQRQAQWQRVREKAQHRSLGALLATSTGFGLIKRLCGSPEAAMDACLRADAVLQRLPAAGITRSQLAADVLGDAHALDAGAPAATLVLSAWRGHVAPLDTGPGESAVPVSPDGLLAGARDTWAAAGVLVNELARPVLHLNLPSSADGWRAPSPGEPAYMSLRQLLRSRPRWDVGSRTVYVCENPNLLAIAADRLGAACAPLVCGDGMPAAAQRTLLRQLAEAGAQLRYHGDYDWPGLRIANSVMREHGALPWRYGKADYLAAAATAPRPGRPLEGPASDAAWDGALAPAMREENLAIDEEAVADRLLSDLA